MKKTIAITFLLLANFIILVHAVVPHHHHYDENIFHHNSDCCETDRFSLACEEESHNHNDDSQKDTCMLQDLLSKLVINTKEKESLAHVVESDIQNYYIADLFIVDSNIEQPMKETVSEYKPYRLQLPSNEVLSSPSLRAPPCC